MPFVIRDNYSKVFVYRFWSWLFNRYTEWATKNRPLHYSV